VQPARSVFSQDFAGARAQHKEVAKDAEAHFFSCAVDGLTSPFFASLFAPPCANGGAGWGRSESECQCGAPLAFAPAAAFLGLIEGKSVVGAMACCALLSGLGRARSSGKARRSFWNLD
jgi:hypothetical protein